MGSESSLLYGAKRRAGRVKRWIKRRWWERNIGKNYRAWLEQAADCVPGSINNAVPIAVIVPVYDPPVIFLRQALESVINQTASNWQLIVVDDGSTDLDVSQLLDSFTQAHRGDGRICVIRKANGGIASAMNAGLEEVRTDHFGWLDHDDVLDPRCIGKFSESLAEGSVDLVYSDEDKIDSQGRHFELYAKPDFSPELLLTQMYLCHFTVFPSERTRAIGGFRSSMDGTQDFDVALRLLPTLTDVKHIPLPLYHWRSWPQSTAHSIEAKPWAQEAGARAQQEHLDRTFGGGSVTPSSTPGLNELHPQIHSDPLVSVIIPTVGVRDPRTASRLVDQAVTSLRCNEDEARMEIIAVTTGTIESIAGVDQQIVYEAEHFNFSEAINLGRSVASGSYLLILNDDTCTSRRNSVTALVEIGQIEGVGAVGAKLTYPDGRLQHVGIIMLPDGPTHPFIGQSSKTPGYFGSTLTPRNFSAVTAAAMLVRSDAFDAVGGFDVRFARDFNDVDFCLRLQEAGYRIAWTPYAHFTHHEGASMARRHPDRDEATRFADRWQVGVDPFYSPALNQALQRMFEAS